MKRIQLFLLLITCFDNIIKEVKYNRYVSPFWSVVFIKDGITLHLEITENKVLPFINQKTHSYLEYEEVFPFVIGIFNMHNVISTGITENVNSRMLRIH